MLQETMTDISIQRIKSVLKDRIFVDTSAWYAITDKNDRDHAVAAAKEPGQYFANTKTKVSVLRPARPLL